MQHQNSNRTAIVYDFDGTLSRGTMQDYGFLPSLKINPSDFWKSVDETARIRDCDHVLMYLWQMLNEAKQRGSPITKEALARHGTKIPLFPGVKTWFGRMNKYALSRKLKLEHYVISSGNLEIIAGCPIYDEFKKVFASKYLYNDQGEAIWPGISINYTTKTQYLFRINKGVLNNWNNHRVNRWLPMEDRPLPFTRMIFIGDGDTDIPSMKMVRYQGGFSIAVFDPDHGEPQKSQKNIESLISEDRVDFVAPANYEAGSQLEIITKGIIGRFARDVGYREADDEGV
uniref:Haloacid dehalogenase-like hydrolase n=1 Tax=Candidatus Kentrum sp. TUN TaxID=2126343 RepID=A0A450ZP92_9GAMM|nr:MAG: haloacid dehalogenase-like hydrolase [Candidatus Kentron sp. TUN]VFK56208.1 MAG: haloacid dehalogenase-like hydrolase [Candidatus Kentron sp. TUN]VFK62452.1 MAG: haloacid dehalogenase-like hydrolase [Candidatus Kentron sp. TUN]